jgi:hypothetical protein
MTVCHFKDSRGNCDDGVSNPDWCTRCKHYEKKQEKVAALKSLKTASSPDIAVIAGMSTELASLDPPRYLSRLMATGSYFMSSKKDHHPAYNASSIKTLTVIGMKTIESQYDTKCKGCGVNTKVGDRIGVVPTNGWLIRRHEDVRAVGIELDVKGKWFCAKCAEHAHRILQKPLAWFQCEYSISNVINRDEVHISIHLPDQTPGVSLIFNYSDVENALDILEIPFAIAIYRRTN